MKINALKFSLMAFIVIGGLSSCGSKPEEKAEQVVEAKEDLAQAENELEVARNDSAKAIADYKARTELRLAENDRLIAELKADMKSDRKEIKEKYEKDLAELNEKNVALKSRLTAYQESASENWNDFKQSVNKDMDELGKSISSKAQKNMKKK